MNHDAINQRIQALESELAGLKAELSKPEKFEFKYKTAPLWAINITNVEDLSKYGVTVTTTDTLKSHFRYRQTETNAQADFQLQKELMCIGALAEQIDPDYRSKVIWDASTNNFTIYYDNSTKLFKVTSNNVIKYLGIVYMPKDVANKVCEILNNKRVEL